ncbi:MAG: DUF6657 family protein [Bacillota bacterium]
MDKIKTAYEKALERISKMNLDSVDVSSMEYVPKGSAAAAQFLWDKDFDLLAELKKYNEGVRGYVREGMEDALLRNIQLPKDESAQDNNRRAMDGLLAIKKDKSALKQIFTELEYLFNYYIQAVEHTYANLKESFAARLTHAQQALERQLGTKVRVDVERQPGFLEEWHRIQGQLDAQYEPVLSEQKEKIRRLN